MVFPTVIVIPALFVPRPNGIVFCVVVVARSGRVARQTRPRFPSEGSHADMKEGALALARIVADPVCAACWHIFVGRIGVGTDADRSVWPGIVGSACQRLIDEDLCRISI